MAYTSLNNLSEAFYNSLQYFLKSNTTIDISTIYVANPNLNISSLTAPFIIVRPFDRRQIEFVMPDSERLHEFYFDIWVACPSFFKQRYLPLMIVRELDKATAVDENGITRPGIQIYSDFDLTTGSPDTSKKLCNARLTLSAIRPFEATTEEEANRKFLSIISGFWEKVKEKDKAFISS